MIIEGYDNRSQRTNGKFGTVYIVNIFRGVELIYGVLVCVFGDGSTLRKTVELLSLPIVLLD